MFYNNVTLSQGFSLVENMYKQQQNTLKNIQDQAEQIEKSSRLPITVQNVGYIQVHLNKLESRGKVHLFSNSTQIVKLVY